MASTPMPASPALLWPSQSVSGRLHGARRLQPSAVVAEALSGGVANDGRVFRVGNTVRRPLSPSAAGSHALLRHLQDAGLGEVPRVLGTDRGAEVLSWIPGQAACSPLPEWAQGEELLISVARLLRRFHDAVSGFDSSPYPWPRERVPAPYRGNFLSHNDVHAGNIICSGSSAVGLIDFDLAGPGSAVWDLAAAVRCWSPLCSDADMPPALLDRRADRMQLLFDAYGASSRMRRETVAALLANHDWTYQVVKLHVGEGHAGFRRYWDAVGGRAGRTRRWLAENHPAIVRAVG